MTRMQVDGIVPYAAKEQGDAIMETEQYFKVKRRGSESKSGPGFEEILEDIRVYGDKRDS